MLFEYIFEKFIVFGDMEIVLTDEQIAHMMQLKTERAIDTYCRELILAAPMRIIPKKYKKALAS